MRARSELCAFDRLGVLGTRQNLPAAGDFYELDSVTVCVIVRAQLLKRFIKGSLAVVDVRSHQAQ